MASLLATLGTACSKKSNSRAKEVIAAENALKAKKVEDDKLKAKSAEEKAAAEKAAATAAEEQAKKDKATSLTSVILDQKSEEDANIAFYQLLLSTRNTDAEISAFASDNKDAEGHDRAAEITALQSRSGKDSVKICEELLKKIENKKDTDLIFIEKDRIQVDVDGVVECRSLNIASNYIDVSAIKNMCSLVKAQAAAIEAKKVEAAKATEAELLEDIETKNANK